MAAFTTLAIIALAGYATAKTVEAKKQSDALKAANAPPPTATTLGGGTDPATPGPGSPAPPDPSLAAQNAAIAALSAAKKTRAKAAGADSTRLGTPGASTPTPKLKTPTLLGGGY